MEQRHGIIREGIVAGALGATAVALWFLGVDALAGRPLATPLFLGRAVISVLGPAQTPDSALVVVAGYTALHYAAFFAVGVLLALLVRRAESEPAVLAGVALLFVVFEIAAYGFTALLTDARLLGSLGWLQVGAANLVAAGLMGLYMWRRHPALVHQLDLALSGNA